MSVAKHIGEEELRAFNDPWVDYFLNEQDRLLSDMRFNQLIHAAESYGRPGSQTEGGKNYKVAATELESVSDKLLVYLLYKGYVKWDDMDMSLFDQAPPKGKK
jgi:hypothetical protein